MSVTFVHSLFDKNTTASASDYISAVLIRMLPCAVNSLFLPVTFSHYVLNISRKVTTPQDTHKRSVLQVYLGSNTSECSAICS